MTQLTPLDPGNGQEFRYVMGHYPTGVCAVTSVSASGAPLAMVVGSFGSVSLDPPLVGFFPALSSTTWPEIEATGRFCVNVLAADQQDLCRSMARKGNDRFDGVAWHLSPGGMPVLADVVAWIDCSLYQVTPAGDHALVLGLVRAMATTGDRPALIFQRGSYGQMA
jgi:flavin reductase (DIM6/NTAB) family NADH-FMN oxidoreductase RutF